MYNFPRVIQPMASFMTQWT